MLDSAPREESANNDERAGQQRREPRRDVPDVMEYDAHSASTGDGVAVLTSARSHAPWR
jgi:hypothetical protein